MATTFSSIRDLETFSSPKIDRLAGPPSLKQNFQLAMNQGTITGIKKGYLWYGRLNCALPQQFLIQPASNKCCNKSEKQGMC